MGVSASASTRHSANDNDTCQSVQCSARVASIAFALIFTKDGRPVAKPGTVNSGKSRAVGFVTYRCATDRNHRYRAHMAGVIVFPPGFTPQRKAFTLFGPSAQLRRPINGSAAFRRHASPAAAGLSVGTLRDLEQERTRFTWDLNPADVSAPIARPWPTPLA